MEIEKKDIFDFSGENFSKLTISCKIIFVIILSIASLNIVLMVAFPESQITTYVSIGLIVIFILYYYYVATKSPGKLRKFSISSECIEILIPYRTNFLIYWGEFEKIEVRLKIVEFKPFMVYNFHFFNHKSEKKVSVSLYDFHKDKIIEFLKILREYAYNMEKEFIAVKETKISGVYLVEDLEIH
ncbi:MAG: hypothetical protein ACFE94_04665 [Candidatus Hodarchaeota archaeon]